MGPNMKKTNFISMFFLLMTASLSPAAGKLDTGQIERITGLKGTMNEAEGVFKVTAPRSDLPVSVDGWKMPPFMGLTTWAGFIHGKKTEAMIAGDLVLFEDEVNPVMSALFENGVAVTALHNHFFFDDPKVYFMHIGGEGPLAQLAKGVKAGLDASRQVRGKAPQPGKTFG